ncbi:MAG: hypothetical protein LBQ30_07280 [Treponema sp.]|jgi:hypothetical protein|nr:hypothetical protein [Treponema sp.]
MYTGIRERRTLAETEFFGLADVSASAGSQGFMSELFKASVLDALSSSKTLQGVILVAPIGNYAFERLKGETVNWTGDVPHFKQQFGLSKEPFKEGLSINTMRNVYLSAVYSTLDYAQCITILKHTLFVIGAAFGIACLTLLLQFFQVQSPYPPPSVQSSYPSESVQHSKNPAPDTDTPGETPEKSTPLPPPAKGGPKTKGAAPSPSAKGAVQGLGEKRIGEESAIRDRLASELHRSAFFEQDVVCMIIELEDTVHAKNLYPLIIDEVIRFFMLPDQIFEKGTNRIALILSEVNLDQGLAKSGEFHKLVLGKYPQFTRNQANLYIGLSSRAGRFINAERLILEANQALEKAREDASAPIVAFRSDPEKYRAFIAAQNTKQS